MIGWDSFTVTSVEDGATVAITREDNEGEVEIVGTAIAEGSTAEVYFDEPIEVGETLTLAITGFNKVTYINDDIPVVADGPYANFTAEPTTILIGETVTFTDASGGGEFTTWDWDFGDGADPATATGEGPHEVEYNTPGQKTVSLTVDDEYETTKENYITVKDIFTLTIDTVNNGYVKVDGDEYTEPLDLAENSNVTLEAIADNEWEFDEWTGDLTGTDNPTNLLMDGDKTITANFVEAPLFYECFTGISEGQIPNGWERDINNYGVNNSNNAGGESPEMQLSWSPSQEGEFYLTTPEINTTEYTTLHFSFKNYLNNFSSPGPYTLRVVAIADGDEHIIWEEVDPGDLPAEEIEKTLTASHGVGAESFQLAWVFDGDTYDMNNWNFDDILLDVTDMEVYTVTFDILDEEGNEIDDAVVTFDGNENDPGEYVFEGITEGTYNYKVERENFVTVEDEVTVDDDITVDVTMEAKKFDLTLNAEPEKGGTIEGEGEYQYEEEVDISAQAEEGWEFLEWTGDTDYVDDPGEANTIVTMPAEDIELTANFEQVPYTITLNTEPEEGGTVEGEGEYYYGEETEISAEAEKGWIFVEWTGDTEYVDDPESTATTVNMPAKDIELTANFEQVIYTLTLKADPEEGGKVEGEGEYYYNEEVKITAVAEENWKFQNWSGDTEHIDDPEAEKTTVTIPDGDLELIANFEDFTSAIDPDKTELIVFPNPARNKFNVKSSEMIKEISLIDISGQMVINRSVNDLQTDFKVNKIQPGIYFMKIHTKEKVITKRVQIIQ